MPRRPNLLERFSGSGRARIAALIAAVVIAAVTATVLTWAGPATAAKGGRSPKTEGSSRPTRTTLVAPSATTSTLVESTATTTPPASSVTTTSPSAPTTTVPVSTTATTTVAAISPATTATTVPPPSASVGGSVKFGAATEGGPANLSALDAFETAAGKPVSLYVYYQSFAFDPNFNSAAAGSLRAQGMTPMITWEPWDPSVGSTSQPGYSLKAIAGGAHDAYINRWASQIRDWGQPLWLRFAHEMNGNWYPWSAGVNGNSAADYVAAWRHVHHLFSVAGAANVTWVWSPNVVAPGFTALDQLYPGDAYVDWLGLDGYNWGTTQSWGSTWQSPTQVFGTSLGILRQLSTLPIVIAETASAEAGGDKAEWIRQFFTMMEQNPAVQAFVWFNFNKETDWRIQSSSASRTAFAQDVADPRYS